MPKIGNPFLAMLGGKAKPLSFTGGRITATVSIRRSPRAKVMRLRVDPRNGAVLLTVPRRVSERQALEWAAGNREWIERMLADIPAAPPLAPGALVPLHGEPHSIEWREGAPRRVRVEEARIFIGGPLDLMPARLLRWLRQHAAELLGEETRYFADCAGVTIGKVRVADPMSRWGSCSATGDIRYSWRLILAPDWVRRATVAHEVAHRVHMDHSPAFHTLVAELLGDDPAPARTWLRRNGASLHRFGRG